MTLRSVFAFWLITCAVAAQAEGPGRAPEFVGIRVGISDRCRLGHWTPVEFIIRGGDKDWEGTITATVADDEGGESRFWIDDQTVKADRETVVTIFARFGRTNRPIVAELQAKDGTVVRRAFEPSDRLTPTTFLPPLDANREIILVIGADTVPFEEAVRLSENASSPRAVVVRCNDYSRLPLDRRGYEALNTIVIVPGPNAPPEDNNPLMGLFLFYMEQWQAMGGRLVLCWGTHLEKPTNFEIILDRELPGRLDNTAVLRQTDALEIYAGASVPIVTENEWRVPKLIKPEGIIEAGTRELPLVVRTANGLGQTVWLAADPTAEPLARWKGRPQLLAKLLDRPTTPRAEYAASQSLMHLGFSDMAGQLRKSLDHFDGVTLVSFWAIVGAIGAFVLFIGPIDYWLLRRFAPRMAWTWVTFPTAVVVACVTGYLVAYATKGTQTHLNHAEIIDVDTEQRMLHGTAWCSLFSPKSSLYDIASKYTDVVTWFGLSGDGLGGMNPRATAPGPKTPAYTVNKDGDSLYGLPIPAWSTRSMTLHQLSGCPKDMVKANLAENDELLEGEVTLNLPCPLENCFLVYKHWCHELGRIEPGKPIRLGATTRRGDLKTFLTGQTIELSENKGSHRLVSKPYDRASLDVAYILKTMMFFDAAGGASYTGLFGQYQGFVDCSSLLKTGRAVLVGFVPTDPETARKCGSRFLAAPTGQTPVDPASPNDPRTIVFRFVLPVKQP